LASGQRHVGQPVAVADRRTTAQPDLPPSHVRTLQARQAFAKVATSDLLGAATVPSAP
jgi:hypothetical protein